MSNLQHYCVHHRPMRPLQKIDHILSRKSISETCILSRSRTTTTSPQQQQQAVSSSTQNPSLLLLLHPPIAPVSYTLTSSIKKIQSHARARYIYDVYHHSAYILIARSLYLRGRGRASRRRGGKSRARSLQSRFDHPPGRARRQHPPQHLPLSRDTNTHILTHQALAEREDRCAAPPRPRAATPRRRLVGVCDEEVDAARGESGRL